MGHSPNPTLISLSGYQCSGRCRVLPGFPLTFAANVREIVPDGTVSVSRPYIRLDRQPAATRRTYARQFGISLDELGLDGDQ